MTFFSAAGAMAAGSFKPGAAGGPTNTPAYAAAGAGTSGTGTLSVPQVAASAGTRAYMHVLVRAASGQAPDTPSGWTLVAGPHATQTPTARQWVFRENANRTGSESGTLSVTFAAGASQKTARMYAFSSDSGGTLEDVDTTAGAVQPVNMPSVTAGGNCRLAVCFIGCDDDNTIDSSTGESGGNWAEAVAEYLGGTNTMINLQTAALATGGTISGGTSTLSNDDEWVTTSFAIVGT
jgi:hypothetical protein